PDQPGEGDDVAAAPMESGGEDAQAGRREHLFVVAGYAATGNPREIGLGRMTGRVAFMFARRAVVKFAADVVVSGQLCELLMERHAVTGPTPQRVFEHHVMRGEGIAQRHELSPS